MSVITGAAWPGEQSLVAHPGAGWHADAGVILIAQPNLTEAEIDALAHQPMRVGLLGHGPLVGLVLQPLGRPVIEMMSWRRWRHIPDALAQTSPDQKPWGAEARLALTLILVEQTTRVVVGQRFFTLSPHMTRALRREVADRWVEPMPDPVGFSHVQEFQARYPSPAAVLKTVIASTRTGD